MLSRPRNADISPARAAFSLDGADSPTYMGRRGSVSRRAPSSSRRCAHEFSREGAYDRDTSFYSEMAAPPHTSIRGLSSSLDRSGDPRLCSGAPSEPPGVFFNAWNSMTSDMPLSWEIWCLSLVAFIVALLPPVLHRDGIMVGHPICNAFLPSLLLACADFMLF